MNIKAIQTGIAVLGGGPAGYAAALRAAQLGAQVVLVEEKKVGGVCLNEGCIPTKTLLRSSGLVAEMRRAKEFGVDVHLDGFHWDGAIKRKDRVVKILQSGVAQLLKERGVTVVSGYGEVKSPNEIFVQGEDGQVTIQCEKLILATGAVPLLPPIPGIELEHVWTSTDALSMEHVPGRVVIIGAGVIGLEFATMFAALGTKVTVAEQQPTVLPGVDEEVTAELLKQMKRQGIGIWLSTHVQSIQSVGNGLSILCRKEEKEIEIECDGVLVAVGRKLATKAFDTLQLKMERGAVWVNENMETSVRGVYAAGDVTGGKLLAHLAFAKGIAAGEHAAGAKRKGYGKTVPACIYTTPEIASVGMTEAEAKQAGIPVKVGRFAFRSNGRALSLGQREGFVKVIAGEDNCIVGGHILGAEASEVISELSLAVTLGLKAEDLAGVIHPHPSLGEAVWEACLDILEQPLHQL